MDIGIQINTTDTEILKGLKKSLNHVVERLKKGWKPSVFAGCFPTLAHHHEASLQIIRNKVLESLSDALYSDLSDVINEELAESLQLLCRLIKENSTPSHIKAWRPTGIPENDILSHDVKALQYEKGKLMEALDKQKKKRQKVFEEVKLGRKQCHENHLTIEKKVTELRTTANMCSDGPVEEIPQLLETNII